MAKKNSSETAKPTMRSGEITWIKIALNMFENEKIRTLEQMPQGDTYVVIWLKLLCMAGKLNDKGMIYLLEGKPYTLENLAYSMNRPVKTVKKALELFEEFKMIEVIQGIIVPSNWEKYQSIDRLNELSEYNRVKQAESRQRNQTNVKQLSNQNQGSSIIEVEVEEEIKNKKEKNNTRLLSTLEQSEEIGLSEDELHEKHPELDYGILLS